MQLLKCRLKLIIPERIFEMLMYWIHKAPGEVSGVGNLLQDEDDPHIYRVTAVVMTRQVNSSAGTEFEGDAHGEALFRLCKRPGVARWYWHSHANFGVFWSGTDTANMDQFDQEGFTIETVINKSREMKTAYVQGRPFLVIDDIPCDVESAFALSSKDQKFCEREYSTYAQIETPPAAVPSYFAQRWKEQRTVNRSLDDWNDLSCLMDKTPCEDDVPTEVYRHEGMYYDLQGNAYEAAKDEEGAVWLQGEHISFPLEDTEDVTDDIEPGTERKSNFELGKQYGDTKSDAFVVRRPTQENLPLIGGTPTQAPVISRATGPSTESYAHASGRVDTSGRSQNTDNGGGSGRDRLIYRPGIDEDGFRERARIRS